MPPLSPAATACELYEAFDQIAREAPGAGLAVAPSDYAELFKTVISDFVVRRPELAGVRVRIYGPLEARLQHVDRVVLGGLVEGVWPPETRSDPWLSRPMRRALGLDLPERRISLSAHDFAQALGANEVILTYPTKLAGAPTVTSRFVQRLAAVAGETKWSRARASGAKYLAWARTLDHPAAIKRADKPMPAPPRAARPTSLSVTEIEHWLRDPYTIYAKHILKVRELEAIDLPPGAANRGILIHAALGEFTETFAAGLPADPAGALITIGHRHFAALEDYPEARAFWWPRFKRIAHWFAAWETQRRSAVTTLAAETSGKIEIPLGERVFTLRARADRIEQLADGRYAILDYKTGQVPTDKQVRIGVSPAAHARSGDPARRRLSRHCRRCLRGRARLPLAQGRRAARPAQGNRLRGRRRQCPRRSRTAKTDGSRHAFRGRAAGLSPAGAPDVEEPVRNL